MTATRLTPEHLAALHAAWRRQGVPWLDQLRPGIPRTELERMVAGFPGVIGDELALWWGWHDGAAGDVWLSDTLVVLGAATGLRIAYEFRLVALDVHGDTPEADNDWPADILPLFSRFLSSDTYAVRCRGTSTDPVYATVHSYPSLEAYPSLGALVEDLLDAYALGAQRWSPATQRWEGDQSFPLDLPQTRMG